jgi:signal transduction histidine kinase
MKFRQIASLIFIILSAPSLLYGQTYRAEKGVMDLRNLENKDKFIVNLNGEWEFYWNQMLYPFNFKQDKKPVPDCYGSVPSYWTDYKSGKVKTEKKGYATYRLTILLPPDIKSRLCLDVPIFDSSYDLWLDDMLLTSNGHPGKTKDETIPQYDPIFLRISPLSDTLNILINVSNFHHHRGGFWMPMRIGTFQEINKSNANKWAGDYAAFSLLMGFAFFFLIFFFLSPKDRIMAFFSLVLFSVALRPLFTSHFLIYDFINLSWSWTIKLEYLSLFLGICGWTWFTDSLYQSKFIRIVSYIITFVFSVSFLLTIFLPVGLFSYSIFPVHVSIVILMIYSLYRSFEGLIQKRLVDGIYFFAFILVAVGSVHDIMVSLGKSYTHIGYVMSFIIVIFIFIHATMLLYKWIIAFNEKEKLRKELEFLNRNLEQMIDERTQELKTRNKEIEKQSTKIALQNKQLSETVQLKNKIFSVIAHDLRSPVVNILYMLNLLKEEEYKEKYDTFANSSIQYAQMVINLLENMLVWGRGQEDKIKYEPSEQDLASIILTNLSIFKESTDRKDITINFTQKGNSFAFFDKALMDIVIRNILSNAVKYTFRGGRISILLKDKYNGDGDILLRICDNGIGIPAAKLKNLFTQKEIQSVPGTEDEKGTGLGLKLCYELIKINGGTIDVESKEGEGTCFIITLPVRNKNSANDTESDQQ